MGLQILTLEPLFATESQRHKYQLCTVCRLYTMLPICHEHDENTGTFSAFHLRNCICVSAFSLLFFNSSPADSQCVHAAVRLDEALKWAAALSLCLPACQSVRVELSAASPLVCNALWIKEYTFRGSALNSASQSVFPKEPFNVNSKYTGLCCAQAIKT